MAKAKHGSAPELIKEIEGAAERMANWIGAHLWQVGGGLAAVLIAVWGFSSVRSAAVERQAEASNALETARAGYLRALGASPGALEAPQLANPATAEAIREEYVEKFRAVAEEHPGTVAGALALFEVADLRAALGQQEETLETWQEALATAEGNPGLQGMLHQRIAASYEEAGDWAQAASAHESAGTLADYPLRYWALVEAARCWKAAGDPVQALALYERVEAEAPDLRLPEHLRSEIRDLRVTRSGA